MLQQHDAQAVPISWTPTPWRVMREERPVSRTARRASGRWFWKGLLVVAVFVGGGVARPYLDPHLQKYTALARPFLRAQIAWLSDHIPSGLLPLRLRKPPSPHPATTSPVPTTTTASPATPRTYILPLPTPAPPTPAPPRAAPIEASAPAEAAPSPTLEPLPLPSARVARPLKRTLALAPPTRRAPAKASEPPKVAPPPAPPAAPAVVVEEPHDPLESLMRDALKDPVPAVNPPRHLDHPKAHAAAAPRPLEAPDIRVVRKVMRKTHSAPPKPAASRTAKSVPAKIARKRNISNDPIHGLEF